MNSYEKKTYRRIKRINDTKIHNYRVSFFNNNVPLIMIEKNGTLYFKVDDQNEYTLTELLSNLKYFEKEKSEKIMKSLIDACELNKKLVYNNLKFEKYNGPLL